MKSLTMRRLPFTICYWLFAIGYGLMAPGPVLAHSTGVYAGTHIIEADITPRSIFVGENVRFDFRLRDLRVQFVQEPFMVAVQVLDEESRSVLFSTSPTLMTDGRFGMSYTFPRAGFFEIEYNFWRPDNLDVIKDAAFMVQVREIPKPSNAYLAALAAAGIAIGFAFAFLVNIAARALKRPKKPFINTPGT